MPEFNGNIYKFLANNISYPPIARDHGVQGKVYVEFVVDKDGVVTDIKIIRGLGYGLDKESVRVVSKMPKWTPGKHNGKPVNVRLKLPISYVLK